MDNIIDEMFSHGWVKEFNIDFTLDKCVIIVLHVLKLHNANKELYQCVVIIIQFELTAS